MVVHNRQIIELIAVTGIFLKHRRADVRVQRADRTASQIIDIAATTWNCRRLIVRNVRFAADINQLTVLPENGDGRVWPRETVGPIQIDDRRPSLRTTIDPGNLLNLGDVDAEPVEVDIRRARQTAAGTEDTTIGVQQIAEINCIRRRGCIVGGVAGPKFRGFTQQRAVVGQALYMDAVGGVADVGELDRHTWSFVALTESQLQLVLTAGQTTVQIFDISGGRITADSNEISVRRPRSARCDQPHAGVANRRSIVVSAQVQTLLQ